MPLAKCPRTGKLFDNTKTTVHPSVVDEEEADCDKILDYLASHPGAASEEVCAETKVSVDAVLRLMKEGRIKGVDVEQEAVKEQERVEEEQRHAEREAERKRRLMAGLASVKKPMKANTKSTGSVPSVVDAKRRK